MTEKNKTTVRELGLPVEPEASDQELLAAVVGHYNQTLAANAAALDFLETHGLKKAVLVSELKLGFCDRSLGLKLPLKNREAGARIRNRLAKLGVLRDTGHEHLRGCLTVPVFDANGALVQLHGIRINGGGELPLEARAPAIWNAIALKASTVVTVTGSLLDALSIWAVGIRNVIGVGGVKTEDLLALLKTHGVKKVVFAAELPELEQEVLKNGIAVFKAKFPKNLTPSELLAKGSADALASALNSAVEVESPEPPAGENVTAAVEAAVENVSQEVRTPVAKKFPDGAPADEVIIPLGDRRYRVRGLAKNTSYDQLRVNLLCARTTALGSGDSFHVDTLDLYAAKQRAAFIKQASSELGVGEDVIRHDLAKVLFRLEELQDQLIKKALEPEEPEVELSDSEKSEALALFKSPDLLDRILNDFERCGVIGEGDNKLVAYLTAVSRKLDEPLAVIVQSSSAAGKTSLMDAVLAFVPEEDRISYSALTGQALYYLKPDELRHKVLSIAEEEGAHRASYALKLLQSERALTIGSTVKDAGTGRLVTQQYRVEGPVAMFTSTTAIDLDPELLNRCIVLTVDEDREQTKAIHRLQRERQTLQGLLGRKDREAIVRLHQNAQRLLRPLVVVNPYAPKLTFLDDRTRTRRDHLKYLGLIRAVTLLFQHQREVKTAELAEKTVEYVEATLNDIAVANRLADKVLGRSLDDLPPHTRKLLVLLDQMVTESCEKLGIERRDFRFSRREVRERIGWGETQLFVHLKRLHRLEYVAVHRSETSQGFVYELLYDGRGKDGVPVLAGLLDVEKLRAEERSGSIRPSFGPDSGAIRSGQESGKHSESDGLASSGSSSRRETHREGHEEPEPYMQPEGGRP